MRDIARSGVGSVPPISCLQPQDAELPVDRTDHVSEQGTMNELFADAEAADAWLEWLDSQGEEILRQMAAPQARICHHETKLSARSNTPPLPLPKEREQLESLLADARSSADWLIQLVNQMELHAKHVMARRVLFHRVGEITALKENHARLPVQEAMTRNVTALLADPRREITEKVQAYLEPSKGTGVPLRDWLFEYVAFDEYFVNRLVQESTLVSMLRKCFLPPVHQFCARLNAMVGHLKQVSGREQAIQIRVHVGSEEGKSESEQDGSYVEYEDGLVRKRSSLPYKLAVILHFIVEADGQPVTSGQINSFAQDKTWTISDVRWNRDWPNLLSHLPSKLKPALKKDRGGSPFFRRASLASSCQNAAS